MDRLLDSGALEVLGYALLGLFALGGRGFSRIRSWLGARALAVAAPRSVQPGGVLHATLRVRPGRTFRAKSVLWTFGPNDQSPPLASSEQQLGVRWLRGERIVLGVDLPLPRDIPQGSYVLTASLRYQAIELAAERLTAGAASPSRHGPDEHVMTGEALVAVEKQPEASILVPGRKRVPSRPF